MKSVTPRILTGCGTAYITLDFNDKGLTSVRAKVGKSGGCEHCFLEAVSRMTKLALRPDPATPEEIAHELCGIRCDKIAFLESGSVLSCCDAIGKAIKEYGGFYET